MTITLSVYNQRKLGFTPLSKSSNTVKSVELIAHNLEISTCSISNEWCHNSQLKYDNLGVHKNKMVCKMKRSGFYDADRKAVAFEHKVKTLVSLNQDSENSSSEHSLTEP